MRIAAVNYDDRFWRLVLLLCLLTTMLVVGAGKEAFGQESCTQDALGAHSTGDSAVCVLLANGSFGWKPSRCSATAFNDPILERTYRDCLRQETLDAQSAFELKKTLDSVPVTTPAERRRRDQLQEARATGAPLFVWYAVGIALLLGAAALFVWLGRPRS